MKISTSLTAVFILLSTNFFHLLEGSEYLNDSPTYSSSSDGIHFIVHDAVFPTKPFDYRVDYPIIAKNNVPDNLLTFNVYLSNLPDQFIPFFAEHCFKFFPDLYPGLSGVPIYPKDVESLIIFGLLYVNGTASTFIPIKFLQLMQGLAAALGEYCSPITLYFADPNRYPMYYETALKELFKMVINLGCFYTVEAFFITGLEGFTWENLRLSIDSSSMSGDSRLVKRIAAMIDSYTRKEIIGAAAMNRSWPEYRDNSLFRAHCNAPIYLITDFEAYPYLTFLLAKKLGKGGSGSCWKISSQATGKQYALKFVSKRRLAYGDRINWLCREIMIQKSIAHDNIVHLFNAFEDRHRVYMIMELCDMSLKGWRSDESGIKCLLRQLVPALQYLHQNGIVHRDIKPDNLLIQGPEFKVKIADFGFSCVIIDDNQVLTEKCGTIYYMAPEIWEGNGYRFDVDLWALGVTVFYLLTGTYPFNGNQSAIICRNIRRINYAFPDNIALSTAVRSLIEQTFQPVGTRITSSMILGHPFLANDRIG